MIDYVEKGRDHKGNTYKLEEVIKKDYYMLFLIIWYYMFVEYFLQDEVVNENETILFNKK